jgi:hypothetical protein
MPGDQRVRTGRKVADPEVAFASLRSGTARPRVAVPWTRSGAASASGQEARQSQGETLNQKNSHRGLPRCDLSYVSSCRHQSTSRR